MITIIQIILGIERIFNIKLSSNYKDFLKSHWSLKKTYDVEILLNSKTTIVCIDKLFNLVELINILAQRNSYHEFIDNEVISIGTFLGSEGVCMGIGQANFGKIYYVESDLIDFVEIAPDFESFVSLLNLPQS